MVFMSGKLTWTAVVEASLLLLRNGQNLTLDTKVRKRMNRGKRTVEHGNTDGQSSKLLNLRAL
jgi:hypothetical protein